jgi:hypothetical protein
MRTEVKTLVSVLVLEVELKLSNIVCCYRSFIDTVSNNENIVVVKLMKIK